MRSLLLFITLSSVLPTIGQVTERRTYLNGVLEPCGRSEAAYYKEANGSEGSVFSGRVFAMDGTLKSEGEYADSDLKVANGHFVFYFADGKVESEGDYAMGRKSGVWKRNDKWGQPLAEKVYDPKPLENIVFTMAQTMPQYPGGEQAMVKYLREKCGKKKGNVTATFVVEKDGKLSDVKVLGADKQSAEQIAQVLNGSPRWQAGSNEGLPVRVQMRVPLK